MLPGQAVDLTTSQHPPNQGQSPQLPFPPLPQSYWSTPPPGEGPPPPTTGLRGPASQSTGWRTSTQQAAVTGRTLQSAGFTEYEQREGHHYRWQY